MANGRSNGVAVGAMVAGAAAVIVGVFLYRRSGRNWNDDVKLAQNWLEDRTDTAQGLIERTEKASKELIASAQDYGHQAVGSAKGVVEGVRAHVN